MTYLGVSALVFLAPFLLGAGLVLAVIAAGALTACLEGEGATGDVPGKVRAPCAPPQAFDQTPGFQIIDFSFRHR